MRPPVEESGTTKVMLRATLGGLSLTPMLVIPSQCE